MYVKHLGADVKLHRTRQIVSQPNVIGAPQMCYIEAQFKLLGSKTSSDRAVLTYTAFVGLAQLRRTTPSLAPQGRGSRRYLTNITQWLID